MVYDASLYRINVYEMSTERNRDLRRDRRTLTHTAADAFSQTLRFAFASIHTVDSPFETFLPEVTF